MSGIDFDPNVGSALYNQTAAIAPAGYKGAELGYDLGQQGATINALHGIDLNDPNSVNAGVGKLVKANALDQASALSTLNWQRYIRSMAPEVQAKLSALGAPAAEGSSDASATPADGSAPDSKAHVLGTYAAAKSAADQLAALPEDQRPAAFQKIKADLLTRGIPEAAIDSAGQHLAGDGPAQLSAHYGDLISHANDTTGATPMPSHASNNWSMNLLNDPGLVSQIGMLKGQGLDYSSLLDTAKTLAGPTIQKNAEVAAAPILAGIDVAKESALAPVHTAQAVNTAIKTKAGTLPYDIVQARANADIAASHDTIEIPEMGDDGQPTGRTNLYRKDVALRAAAGGQPIGGKPSPNEQEGRNADASLFMKNYASDANQPSIQADKTARDVALAAARLAQSPGINPSNLTDWVAHNANTLNGIGIHIAADKANDLATYKNLVDQNLKNGITVFPRNEVEFHAIANGVANAKMPGDAAALALTETAALRDAAAAYKQYRIDYAAQHPNNFSERAFQTAWAQQPQANQSIFASPVFQSLKFNGKPAVAVMQQPYTDGHTYGVFMPGTVQKTVFRVR